MFVRPVETRDEALRLVAAGVNDCEIARRLGVPRTTVRDWRKPRYVAQRPAAIACPRCGERSRRIVLEPETYAELLGLYLGDGHITQMARSERLRLFLDAKYPTIVDEAEALLRSCFPDNRVGRVVADEGRMVVLWAYSSHLTCLFPQHGAGKKHERPIVLEPWQQELVDAAPVGVPSRLHPLRRLRLRQPDRAATSTSATTSATSRQDILGLFEAPAWSLGLRPRRYARRESASTGARTSALLVEHVGLKSLSRHAVPSWPFCGCGGIGRRAGSGARELYARGGSSPLSRIPSLP